MSNRKGGAYQGWQKRTISTRDEEERTNWLKKLTLNKWSLTLAVMLVMFSAWLGLEEVDRRGMANMANMAGAGVPAQTGNPADEVLYVTDTVPYDIQRVNADI